MRRSHALYSASLLPGACRASGPNSSGTVSVTTITGSSQTRCCGRTECAERKTWDAATLGYLLQWCCGDAPNTFRSKVLLPLPAGPEITTNWNSPPGKAASFWCVCKAPAPMLHISACLTLVACSAAARHLCQQGVGGPCPRLHLHQRGQALSAGGPCPHHVSKSAGGPSAGTWVWADPVLKCKNVPLSAPAWTGPVLASVGSPTLYME